MRLRLGLSTRTLEPALCPAFDGLGVYTAALLQHLPEQNIEVSGYAYAPGGDHGVLRHSLPLPRRYGRDLAATLLPGAGRGLDVPVDVFHFTDHRVVRTRMPCVATVHDAIPLQHPEWMPGRWRGLKNLLLQRTIATADWFVAVSRFAVGELCEAYRLPADRISVVPNGIDESWLAPPPADADERRRQWQLPENPYFLFVGTFQPRKNLDRILAAYAALPSAVRHQHPLVIVGREGWGCDATVARLRSMRQSGEAVHWIQGLRDRETLRAIYAGAAALVFTTLHEGFGIPVLEAFASRAPVITSNTTSLPEVAGDAALLVNPTDVEAISHAMQRLAEDVELAASLRDRGWRRAGEFRWSATAAGLAKVYRDLAGRA